MFFKVGQFLRLIDENGQLSLTNIALMIALGKLIAAPSGSIVDTGTVLVALLGYAHKKVLTAKTDMAASDFDGQISDVLSNSSARISEIENSVKATTGALEERLKDLTGKISTLNLAIGIRQATSNNKPE